MFSKFLCSGIILSGALALGACTADGTSRDSHSSLDPATLQGNVTAAVHAVPGVNPSELQVSTRNGVVHLSGRTQTRAQAQDAIEAARHVPGVESVDYDIDVDEY